MSSEQVTRDLIQFGPESFQGGDRTAGAMSQGNDDNEWFMGLADISGRGGNCNLGNKVAEQLRGFFRRPFCSPSAAPLCCHSR